MKISGLVLSALVGISLVITPLAWAKSGKADNNSGSKVDIKCHLQLVGGGETIHYARLFKANVRGYGDSLYKQKIWVAGMKGKHEVYKVNQCQLADKKFKLSRANTLESEIVK